MASNNPPHAPNSQNASHNNSNKPNALQKMNPMMWRQSRTVKKAVDMVDEFTAKGATPFLDSTEGATPLAVFYRSEIVTGKLLGEGSFSTVSEIQTIQLQHLNTTAPFLTPPEEARRTEVVGQLTEDRHSPLRFALKQIKRDLLRKPYDFGKAIADLDIEAKYLSRLDHPNILGLKGMAVGGLGAFDSGRFDSYFLVLDRLTDSLDQRIQQWQKESPAPDPTQIARKTNYALQIANALLYLHQRHIIFRDLKPENIGFAQQGDHVCQLFDFGLAREIPQGLDDQQFTMTGAGSQWYMAVEIFITGKYNLKADVYSWAITFYEMLSETKPFAKMNKLQHVAMVCVQGKRPSLSTLDLPKGVESIIRQAWGQSVRKRPNIRQVVRTLEKMLPDLGDESACVWPTVEYDASLQAEEDEDDEEGSLERLLGNDEEIDEHIIREMKKEQPAARRPTLGDLDENEYSFSSLIYGDH